MKGFLFIFTYFSVSETHLKISPRLPRETSESIKEWVLVMSPSASIVPSGGECKVFKARVSSVDSSSNGPDVMQGEKSKRWETVRKIVQERKRNR